MNKLTLLMILLLILFPARNIFGIWFLTLLHFFQVGLLVELVNIFLKGWGLKYWSSIYNSFSIPVVVTILLFCYGYYNIDNIKRVEYNIFTEKLDNKGYRVGLLSDIHFGNSLDEKKLYRYVERLNKENLDILVLAGDIVDESSTLQDVKDIFKILGEVKTNLGIYYVYGNHDKSRYRRKANYSIEELEKNIKEGDIFLLEDKNVELGENLTIVGRKDRSSKNRESGEELLKRVDKERYLILVDHQPVELKENSRLGYDLQLSGHTHNGQIFPANLIIKFFNLAELIYGHRKIGGLDVVVSSGMSGWGYPLRTTGNSEYVIINILKK